MEVKLNEFVRQIQTLADVRNSDVRNPIALDYDVPGLSMRFRIVGSISEPTFQAYPINLIWVVLDPNSQFYRRVLQLRSHEANDPTVEDRIVNANFLGTWVELLTYDSMFVRPQYYVHNSGGGSTGPAGADGADGYVITNQWSGTRSYSGVETVFHLGSSYVTLMDNNVGNEPGFDSPAWKLVAQKGDTPDVDYDSIVRRVVDQLRVRPVALVFIEVPSALWENTTQPFKVGLKYLDNSVVEIDPALCTFSPDPTSLLAVNVEPRSLTAAEVSEDTPVTLTAVYTDYASDPAFTATEIVTIRNKIGVSINVTGPATIEENTTGQYNATITFNDGSTIAVPAEGRVWSVSTPDIATISENGLVTAGEVTADTPSVVSCAYTAGGITLTGTRAITILNVVQIPHARFGVYTRVTSMATYTSEFVNDVLTNVIPTPGFDHRFEFTTGTGQYCYYAHPKQLGEPKFEDMDARGFFGGWDGARNNILSLFGPYEIEATVDGVTEQWLIYRTDHANLGDMEWEVTPA